MDVPMDLKKFYLSIGIIIATMLHLASCSLGQRAEIIDTPKAALEEGIETKNHEELFNRGDLPDAWWTLFQDEQLTTFIETAFRQNPTLHEAHANILLAASNARRVRANQFPNIFWGGDISREKLSETGLIPFNNTAGGAAPTNSATAAAINAAGGMVPILPTGNQLPAAGGVAGIPVYFTQYETEFALNYDFDIWKKNQNTFRAALGEYYANIADEVFLHLELGISVALVYYQLQIDYKKAEIAKKLIENQARYAQLVQTRKTGNIDAAGPVYNTLINVISARQALLEIEANIAVNEYQLKTYLAGQFHETINDIQINEQPLPKIPLPDDLPLSLIARRPDITAQLWLIESAGKQIEVAKAGFYPDFNIIALFGFQTIHLHELFNWKSCYYNVDPAFSLPIFDGGRLSANLTTSEINYDIAIYRYNALVLNAVRDVLDGLTLLRNADLQLKEAQNKVRQQEDLLQLTILKRQNHLSSELDFLVSQQAVFIAQNVEIITLGKKIQAMLSLIKALGAGYNTCMQEV